MKRFASALLLLTGLLISPVAQAAERGWRVSWAASPAPPMPPGAKFPIKTPGFNDQTVVQVVRLSAGGTRVRLRLSNEYGVKALAIGHARVALLGKDGAPLAGTEREVTFGGMRAASLPPHAPLLSDPVALDVPPLADLQVRLYLPGDTGPCTCHALGLEKGTVSPPGDFTDKPFTPTGTVDARAFLSAVEVEGGSPGPSIIAFGDSITDGYQSSSDMNRRWPDRLAERLTEAGVAAAVANEGIGGNRVLSDGAVAIFGDSALTRFDRDVLAHAGTTHLIVLEGVNDLGGKPTPSADELIAGYRQILARAHAHGIKVIFATVLPYKGAAYFRDEGEAARTAVNTWIRSNHEADGVIDFDRAMRDPADPARMKKALQSGDWLHPNDAGYRVMGDAIDLKLFR
jgi:lysophospholipase L1-like esterase